MDARVEKLDRDDWLDRTIALVAWCLCTKTHIKRGQETFLPKHLQPDVMRKAREAAQAEAAKKIRAKADQIRKSRK